MHELDGNGQMDMLAWICRYNIPEEEMRMRIAWIWFMYALSADLRLFI